MLAFSCCKLTTVELPKLLSLSVFQHFHLGSLESEVGFNYRYSSILELISFKNEYAIPNKIEFKIPIMKIGSLQIVEILPPFFVSYLPSIPMRKNSIK